MSKSVYFLVEKMIDILNMYVWKYNGGKKRWENSKRHYESNTMYNKAPISIMNKVMTKIPMPVQIRAEYNRHLISFELTFLARISDRDDQPVGWFNLRLFWWIRLPDFSGWLSNTSKSSKSSPSCFFRVTKQSNSIMAALIITNGRHRVARTIGKIIAWNRSLSSVLKDASIAGICPKSTWQKRKKDD